VYGQFEHIYRIKSAYDASEKNYVALVKVENKIMIQIFSIAASNESYRMRMLNLSWNENFHEDMEF
jgi:hypothetical protein